MNWNTYIDKSYENMITILFETGKGGLRTLTEEQQNLFVSSLAYVASIQKDYLIALRDVSEVVFDEDMRVYLNQMHLDEAFVESVRENDPIKADQIVQQAANDINVGVVREWLEDFLEE